MNCSNYQHLLLSSITKESYSILFYAVSIGLATGLEIAKVA